MMKYRFVTNYDYFLAILASCCFIFVLLINRDLLTILIASLLFTIAIYKAFGKRIRFTDENIIVRTLSFQKILSYSDVSKLRYTTRLYGKSFITVFCSQKKHKALLNFTEWQQLKAWIENKGIDCEEDR